VGWGELRWGQGKSGGARLIYYFAVGEERILLLDIYAKNEKSDVSREELKKLDDTAAEWAKRI
jgi:hypothetical protein